MTIFLRLLDAPVDDKARALKETVGATGVRAFDVALKTFAQVPGSPFAYWVSDRILCLFSKLQHFESDGRHVRVGDHPGDGFRYIRLPWELWSNAQTNRWRPYQKGGVFSPYYSDLHLMVNWDNARQTYSGFIGRLGRANERPSNYQYFFRPGLTWPRRTQSGLGLRVMPAGCIFADKGPAAFVEGDDREKLLGLLAVTTSAPFRYLVELQMAFGSYEVGVIQRTPVPNLTDADGEVLARLTRRAWSLKRNLDTVNETSHAFLLPAALRARLGPFDPSAIEAELTKIQSEIDDLAFRLYGLDGEDRAEIERWACSGKQGAGGRDQEGERDEPEDSENSPDPTADISRLTTLSWCVGVVFGRFDIRLATGERMLPHEPEPFDPLPTCSPGMMPDNRSVRAVLVDDPGHSEDLGFLVQGIIVKVDGPETRNLIPDDPWRLAPDSLRQWFAKEFFPLHIKMYSKSRRKAPIYWRLSTPSASYSVWLYIHAFTKDSLYQVQNDYVAPKLAHEERKLETMRAEYGASPKAAERKQLAVQEALLEELRTFLEEVRRVAPLWNPDLDDGVIINFAPLWRLVPQYRPWQKELKATWDALCAGEYDWAHLSMHLWPERVIPKCATDRSLAIAHGLEDVFWAEGADGKWKPRPELKCPIEELVRERTSWAVKAALKGLLEAPAIAAAGRRRSNLITPRG